MKAMAALKHLALYLSGTEHVGVMLRKCETYEDVFDRWVEADEWSDVTREQRKDKAVSTSTSSQIRHGEMIVLLEDQQVHVLCL